MLNGPLQRGRTRKMQTNNRLQIISNALTLHDAATKTPLSFIMDQQGYLKASDKVLHWTSTRTDSDYYSEMKISERILGKISDTGYTGHSKGYYLGVQTGRYYPSYTDDGRETKAIYSKTFS